MGKKILLSAAILSLVILVCLIIFSNNGLLDLVALEKKRSSLTEKNKILADQNLSLYREINRLKNDSEYIESLVRKELRLIGEGEFVFKSDQERWNE